MGRPFFLSKPTSPPKIAELKEAFQESELPFRVDLLDWNAISDEFRIVIEKSGYEVISGRSSAFSV